MSDESPEEVLQRAQATVQNSLDDIAGPCCDPRTKPLRNQIISLLSSEACQDISFIAGQIRIDGANYRSVMNWLQEPKHKLHITVDPAAVEGKGLAGKYNPSQNRLFFPFAGLGGNEENLANQCETIVHECTHASITYGKDQVVNEVASWFAGVLFLRGQGMPITGGLDFRKNLRALADDARKANVQGKVFIIPEIALVALKSDIVHGYQRLDKNFGKN